MATLTKKNLMVDDFVCFTHENEVQKFRKWTSLDFADEKITNIQPIEITDAFLKRNKFKELANAIYKWRLIIGNIEISLRMNNQYSEMGYCNLIHNPEDVTEANFSGSLEFDRWLYIHDLQHFCNMYNIEIDWKP